jgi:hypothetical protein
MQGDIERYKGIHGDTRGNMKIQGDTWRYKEINWDKRGYRDWREGRVKWRKGWIEWSHLEEGGTSCIKPYMEIQNDT